MVQNVSSTATCVVAKTTENSARESSDFNKVLKGKIESQDGKSSFDEKGKVVDSKMQNVSSEKGTVIDEVLSTVKTITEDTTNLNEDNSLEEILNSLNAILDMLKLSPKVENQKQGNNDTQSIGAKIPDISSILNGNLSTDKLDQIGSNLQDVKTTLTKIIETLSSDNSKIEAGSDKLSVLQGLLKELGVNVNELNKSIPSNLTSSLTLQTTELEKVNILSNNINVQASNQTKQENTPANILVQTATTGDSKDIINQISNNENKVETGKVQEIETILVDIKKQVNDLLETNKNSRNFDGIKVANSENQIVDFNVVPKFNQDADNSKEESQNSSLKENTTKEDKLLKSLTNEKEDLPVNRFTLLTNSTTTPQAVNKVGIPTINKETIVSDVIKTVKYMVSDGVKELAVKINPKELGEVIITLVQEEGAIKASIKATSKDTYNLLSQNLIEMKKNLAEQNIKVQGVDISLNQEMNNYKEGSYSNGNFEDGNSRNRFNQNSRSDSATRASEETESDYLNEDIGNLNMLV